MLRDYMCNVTCCHSIATMMGCSAINCKPDEPFRLNTATCWVFAHNNLKSNSGPPNYTGWAVKSTEKLLCVPWGPCVKSLSHKTMVLKGWKEPLENGAQWEEVRSLGTALKYLDPRLFFLLPSHHEVSRPPSGTPACTAPSQVQINRTNGLCTGTSKPWATVFPL